MNLDTFARLKKLLQTEDGQLLVHEMSKEARLGKPTPGQPITGEMLGVLYGTGIGFQGAVEWMEKVRDTEFQKPSQEVGSTYEESN